jgi:3-isopropylmalate/(R)-2-methylmalate dehydratase small subunit
MKTCRIWKMGDNIDTDQIIASQYLLLPGIDDIKKYAFESMDPEIVKNFKHGDVIVGGYNYGCGSSREQAPAVIMALGAGAVIARSFARIFFRNAVNLGLPLVICDEIYEPITDNEQIEYSVEKGILRYGGVTYSFNRFPDHIMNIIRHGGLIESINKE